MTSLTPMTPQEYAQWLGVALRTYADDKIKSGECAAAEAEARVRAEHAALVPQGRDTPGHHFLSVRIEGVAEPVGALWFGPPPRGDAAVAYVYDFAIASDHRRCGHGRAAFLALEALVASLGLTGIELHVFGHNTPARSLYEGLGYAARNIVMFKPVRAA